RSSKRNALRGLEIALQGRLILPAPKRPPGSELVRAIELVLQAPNRCPQRIAGLIGNGDLAQDQRKNAPRLDQQVVHRELTSILRRRDDEEVASCRPSVSGSPRCARRHPDGKAAQMPATLTAAAAGRAYRPRPGPPA